MHQWSTTPLNNQTADSRANWQEGQPASSLNNSARGTMATAAFWRDDNLGIALTATAGSNNVYTVSTGQGLIDPATVSGTPAITHPFSVRFNFSAAPTGMATNALKIAIDGAAAVQVYRYNGTALVDGDIATGRPYLLVGDTITAGAITRLRVFELLPSDIKALIPAPTASAAKSLLIPGAPNTLPGFGQSKVTTYGTPDDATGGSAAGLISFSAGRLTIGANGAGVWGLGLGLSVPAPSGVNYGFLAGLYRNGSTNPEVTAEFVNSSINYFGQQPITGLYPVRCAAGDYFDCYELVNYQSSGVITISVKIAAVYLGA